MLPLKNHETLRLYGNKQEFPAFAFKNSEIELKRVMPDKFRRRSQCPIIDSHDSMTPAVNSVQLNLGDFSYAAWR